MMELKLVLTIIFFLKIGSCKQLQYYTNFKFENLVIGAEELMTDYVTLANDPKENLPDTFTICSSVLIKYVITNNDVFQILKEDGTPWFVLVLKTMERDYSKLSEKMVIFYMNPTTDKLESDLIYNKVLPIVPHSWYHVCMGLNTVSGLLMIVVNGIEIINEKKDYFENTRKWKPNSVEGKILGFKAWAGFWYQHRSAFSNMNIFSSMLSLEDMVSRTLGGEGCDSPGDYLRLYFAIH